jgi:hypothetical protein
VICERVVHPAKGHLPTGQSVRPRDLAGEKRPVHLFKKLVGLADYPGMDLPETEAER